MTFSFFDTTSTYIEEEDEDGLRRYGGYFRDRSPNLPEAIVGLAVTKEGIPVRCWVLPGNIQDMNTVEMVKSDLKGWKLSRCIWVMDRGMVSEENKIILQSAGGHYIIGERLCDTHGDHKGALSCRGKYHEVRENLRVKEVERVFRTLKTTLELRPIYHRKDEWIKAHVLLCFLALVLVRIAERQTGLTWDKISSIMERMHLGEFKLKDRRILQRSELTTAQANILKKLGFSPPPRLHRVDLNG